MNPSLLPHYASLFVRYAEGLYKEDTMLAFISAMNVLRVGSIRGDSRSKGLISRVLDMGLTDTENVVDNIAEAQEFLSIIQPNVMELKHQMEELGYNTNLGFSDFQSVINIGHNIVEYYGLRDNPENIDINHLPFYVIDNVQLNPTDKQKQTHLALIIKQVNHRINLKEHILSDKFGCAVDDPNYVFFDRSG